MPTKKQIRDALKARIKEDDQHGFFKEDTWQDTTFGLFYDNDEEFIDKAVFEVTEHLVQAEGLTLPNNAAAQLEGDVNAGNTPGEAIDPMFIAAGKALPADTAGKRAAGKKKPAKGAAKKKSTGGGKGKASVKGKKASGASGKSSGAKSKASKAKGKSPGRKRGK